MTARTPLGLGLALADVTDGATATIDVPVRFAPCPRGHPAEPPRAGATTAAPPRVVVAPASPTPGTLVTLTVRAESPGVAPVRGVFAGEPVIFRRDSSARYIALAAVPLDSGPTVRLRLAYTTGDSLTVAHDTLIPISAPPPAVAARAAKAEPLRVAPEFSRPPTSDLTLRIDGENDLARTVGTIALATPPLWRAPFARPRSSRITSPFASGRRFNGTLTSRHTGLDFRGATGDTVVASNRGVVALVADFFLAGTVVYVVHGAGLVTGYFHLSATRVAIGDTVERGQVIGLVGHSGRVTGPHLHWVVRYDHTVVDPYGVLSLGWLPSPASRREIAGACDGSD